MADQPLLDALRLALPDAALTEAIATAIGPVRFRDLNIPLPVLTDGDHIIVIVGAGQPVACGVIPAL